VWGWLAGLFGPPARWSVRVVVSLLLATGVFVGEVGLLTDGLWAAAFIAAASVSLLFHVVWRYQLRERYGRPAPPRRGS
jgi:hypothetical protein